VLSSYLYLLRVKLLLTTLLGLIYC